MTALEAEIRRLNDRAQAIYTRLAAQYTARIRLERDTPPPPPRDSETDWRQQASCAGTDPEAWFIDTGDYPSDLFRICAACPVREECLESALAEEGNIRGAGRFGIRGGATPRERAQIARQRRQENAA